MTVSRMIAVDRIERIEVWARFCDTSMIVTFAMVLPFRFSRESCNTCRTVIEAMSVATMMYAVPDCQQIILIISLHHGKAYRS